MTAAKPLAFGNQDATPLIPGAPAPDPASGGIFGNFQEKLPQLLMALAFLDSSRPRVNPPALSETIGHIAPLMQMLGQQQSQKQAMNFMNTALANAPPPADLAGGGAGGSPDISAYTSMSGGQAPGPGVMAAGNAGPSGGGSSVDKFLDLTGQHESGWRNIMQQAVGPNGGYNPSTGGVTGPSSAQGFYQITNSTWKDFAPKAGVDLGQFPTAMSAPPDVQRQVARTIATTSGVQHWTNYNPRLRAAAMSVGLPVSGPIADIADAAPSATPIPTQGNAPIRLAQATPTTMTDASPASAPPAAAPSPVQSPRAAVGQAHSEGALPNVSQRQAAQAQAAMPNTMPPRSPETVSGPRTQAATAQKMFDYWGRVAVGAGTLGTAGSGMVEYAKAQMALAGKFMEPTELEKNISKLPPQIQDRARYVNAMKGSPELEGQTAAVKAQIELQNAGPMRAAQIGAERSITEPSDIRIATAKEDLTRESTRQQQTGAASLEPTTIMVRMPDGSMVERQVTRKQYAEMVGGGTAAPANAAGAPQSGAAPASGSAVFGKPYQTPGQIRGSETRSANEENQIPVLQKDAEGARTDIALLRSMKDAAGNIHQGVLAGPTQTVARMMRMVDPSFDKQVAGYEELTKNVGTFVRNAVRGTDSNPSTQQFNMIAASLPQPETSPLGFRRVTDQMLGLAQYKAAKAQALPAYEQMNGGGHAGYENWFYKNVTPYAFIISAMHPDDRKELYMRLQGSDQGKRELQMLRPQLEFIHQQGLDQ